MKVPSKQSRIQAIVFLSLLMITVWRLSSMISPDLPSQFPQKPIQIVVPYLAGGGTDTFARILQKSLNQEDSLGEEFVVTNKDGGSATIGSRQVKDAPPDGHQLLCHHEGIIATQLAGVVDYGPEAFRPIAQTGSIVLLMVVRADSEYRNLNDLLQAAQKKPNTIRIGANQGSPAYFICKQLLAEFPGADFNFISAGGAKRYTYLLGGKLEAGIFSLAEYVSFRNSDDTPENDNILAIGNFGDKRHPTIPNVATSTEQNLKTRAENAYYIWAPKDTPDNIADLLARTFRDTLKSPEVTQELQKLSIDPTFRSGEELQKHLAIRVEAFQKISADAKTELPNFPIWVIGIVAILLISVIVSNIVTPNLAETSSPSSSLNNKGATFLGVSCLLILIAYVAALQFKIPFGIATPLTIFLMGLSISKFKRKHWLILGIIGLGFSLTLEIVFTQLFSVALP
jgi:tripartite-type tricarboxylate transporter receptor subunit TctC